MKTNLISIILVLLMLFVMYQITNEICSFCCCCVFPTSEKNSQIKAKSQWPTDMLAGIKIFLRSHSQFGKPIYVQNIPNWAQGKRQRVQFSNGRNLLFYLKEDTVITIYENNPHRTKIWGDYNN